ncbi:hypothetical protein ACQPXM_02305 [Kribbella sp. CA-253562]|uniref:hypothetical protein n=1 Tax=Kribbella sp. CA-253562 TaxID=3239942 RepID=UPI003D91CB50
MQPFQVQDAAGALGAVTAAEALGAVTTSVAAAATTVVTAIFIAICSEFLIRRLLMKSTPTNRSVNASVGGRT